MPVTDGRDVNRALDLPDSACQLSDRASTGRLKWAIALAIALSAGAALRLVWANDMEYKLDEIWTFEHVQQAIQTGSLPGVGMPSSVERDNPGMSLWVFVALGWLCDARDPVELVRTVQVLNVLALLLQVVLTSWFVPAGEREPWYWSAALLAVNPLAVLFHRKIWPPSVLPAFIMIMLMCWFRRERRGAAFGWGLIGAVLGQIHMGGFIFAAAFALWTRLFGRQRVAWRYWFVGGALGALPLLPWLEHLVRTHGQGPALPLKWSHLVEFKFWIRWCLEPFGLGIDYALGKDAVDFLSKPHWHGHPTWLVAALHLAVVSAAVCIVGGAVRRAGARGASPTGTFSDPASTQLAQNAVLWGYGLLLTFCLLPIHRHYNVIAQPFEMLWLARLALGDRGDSALRNRRRTVLAGLCVLQLAISGSFLAYVHTKQSIRGDYGTVYQAQQRSALDQRR